MDVPRFDFRFNTTVSEAGEGPPCGSHECAFSKKRTEKLLSISASRRAGGLGIRPDPVTKFVQPYRGYFAHPAFSRSRHCAPRPDVLGEIGRAKGPRKNYPNARRERRLFLSDKVALQRDAGLDLALAVVDSSTAPLLLLDGDLIVIAASASFCAAFTIDPAAAAGSDFRQLGKGEWNIRQLVALLVATASGHAGIDSYEMDFPAAAEAPRRLVVNARRLVYGAEHPARLLLAVTDITEARDNARAKDDLIREKEMLLQEMQHRIANSLQIIASVLLQSARRVASDETRNHLYAAHQRVMSIASMQKLLAVTRLADVELRAYFIALCRSIGASMIHDPTQLTLEVDSDEATTAAEISVTLGLMVTELVINALKHAYPGSRHGTITVAYRTNADSWTLSVADDGVGLPRDPESRVVGLGTTIVRALAKRLRASVLTAEAHPGTLVTIHHPAAEAEH